MTTHGATPPASAELSEAGELLPSRRGVLALLALATMIGATGLAAGGTAGALLGADLAGGTAAAGLPLGLLVLGSAVSALAISRQTSRIGRGRSLAAGYLVGVVGAALVITAAAASSLVLLYGGSILLGAANAAIFLTRYAAIEIGGGAARGRALGAVFFGTSLGAVLSSSLLGPAGSLAHTLGLPRASGLYLIALATFSTASAILAGLSTPRLKRIGRHAALLGPTGDAALTRNELREGLAPVHARAALVILAAANFVMVAVMAIAPVHLMSGGMTLQIIGVVISLHVAGMFGPAPLSGWLADRAGPVAAALAGFIFVIVAGLSGAFITTSSSVAVAVVLVTLGVGWNFGVVGGSTLLAAAVTPAVRPYAEGIGEAAMGIAAAVAAPSAGAIVAYGSFAGLWLVGAALAAATLLYLALALRKQEARLAA